MSRFRIFPIFCVPLILKLLRFNSVPAGIIEVFFNVEKDARNELRSLPPSTTTLWLMYLPVWKNFNGSLAFHSTILPSRSRTCCPFNSGPYDHGKFGRSTSSTPSAPFELRAQTCTKLILKVEEFISRFKCRSMVVSNTQTFILTSFFSLNHHNTIQSLRSIKELAAEPFNTVIDSMLSGLMFFMMLPKSCPAPHESAPVVPGRINTPSTTKSG
jgi:hypothetical protein